MGRDGGRRLHVVSGGDGPVDPMMVGPEPARVAEAFDRLDGVAADRVAQGTHHGGDQTVARGLGDGDVEGGVVFDEILGRRRVVHPLQRAAQDRQVGPLDGGARGGPLFDHQPGVDDLLKGEARQAEVQPEQVGQGPGGP
ncbi:hypothetical protein GCM10023075_31650 [Streptosporangium album]